MSPANGSGVPGIHFHESKPKNPAFYWVATNSVTRGQHVQTSTLAAGRPVLILTLSNPEARNAINPSVYRAAAKAIRATAGFRTVRAIVLRGEGDHFSGGGDLRRLARQRKLPAAEQRGHIDALHEWLMAIEEAPQPVIAAVEGAAMGGGFSLSLACDLIVAAEDAKFAMSYINVGLSPDGGGTDSLARALPPQAALEMLLDGTPCTARRLHELGVVNKVVPHGEAGAAALAWAQQLARGPFEGRRASSSSCMRRADAAGASSWRPSGSPS
ncbi:enoyl-CoA hydratase/isomerase domain-containing protein [Ditylenchus destructor]|uniref:Enoyl-CoA hydratase/isomerase domain-containing protein n=1 Tax=Ditylenchus destructor TaxID=166010 RepID=A0AAD4QV60_9BILA|nr:enoyl-CoA hydratase/isomerase domain-containing protein [Ditylenchus destructor]